MIRDVLPFERVWNSLYQNRSYAEAVARFVQFLERRLGGEFVYEDNAPFERAELLDLFKMLDVLRAAGVILAYGPMARMSDEPGLAQWHATYRQGEESHAGGATLEDERLALTKTIAEAVERHIWFEKIDYFRSPTVATVEEISRRASVLLPERFAGFSPEQRNGSPRLTFGPNDSYVWIKGYSWTQERDVWLPAQTVSGCSSARELLPPGTREPLIRLGVSTGLSTHPSREQAVLSGAYEIIERDAYMIMWLNRLTLPRLESDELAAHSAGLRKLIERCRRYRLTPHFVRMLSDAPVHAVCAVLEDLTETQPRLSIGISAHHDLTSAAEKALIEALRGRRGARARIAADVSLEKKIVGDIGHYDRLLYWASGENYKKLRFLYEGPVISAPQMPTKELTPEERLEELLRWMREHDHEMTSVSFTRSSANLTPWHIEMVVIPDMQPIYYHEALPCASGERLKSVPEQFGYTKRPAFYLEEPHPFA